MSSYQYLKSDSYYKDRYDLHTIETCLDYYWSLKNNFETHSKDKEFKKFTKKQFDEDVHKAVSYTINAIKMERFRHKKETVQKWIDADRERQHRLDNAIEPENILCPQCDALMLATTKDLENNLNQSMRVLFFFECPNNCKRRRGVYDDGSDFKYTSPLCPRCKHRTKLDYKIKDQITIWTTLYSSCGYKEVKKDNLDKWEIDRKKKEEKDKILLGKYRDDFCYSEEDGQEAIYNHEQLSRLINEWKGKDKHKEEYKAVAKIKKITVVELETLLNNAINPHGYIRLELSKPEFGKQLIVCFNVQNNYSSRQAYDSRNELRKLVQKSLTNTNWRLMLNTLSYRSGYLQGRLKAYETEKDLLKLVK